MKATWMAGLVGGVAGAAALALFQWAVPRPVAVATVDLSGLIAEQVRAIQGRSDAEVKAAGERWGLEVERVLAQMSQEFQTPILVRQAVVAGAPDVTLEVRRRLFMMQAPLPAEGH